MKKIEESKNYYLESGANEISIWFYPRKERFTIIFICVWLVFWGVGVVDVLDSLVLENEGQENPLFLMVWLVGWTVGGVYTFIELLWMLAGEQIVEINRESLKIVKKLGLISFSKKYEIEHIIDLRICEKEKSKKTNKYYKSSLFKQVGFLCFHYKGEKKRFGLDIDKLEAESILNKIKEISRFSDLQIG